jgi:transcriptional regulator with XRE-family HTH domain
MKTKPNQAMRDLRKIIKRTQGEFAAMIGASKDAVASWEIGRNKLSAQFARRIAFATGVEEASMLRGHGPLTCRSFTGRRAPFSVEMFEHHTSIQRGVSEEATVRRHLRNCMDALELLLVAASQTERKVRNRMPAVMDSFSQWCERTRADFQLDKKIEEQLRQRKSRLVLNHTYRQWRTMLKEDPTACRLMGFKDNPRKADGENLRLEAEMMPMWRPGYPMRGKM